MVVDEREGFERKRGRGTGLKKLSKTTDTSSRLVCVLAEIERECLPNMSPERTSCSLVDKCNILYLPHKNQCKDIGHTFSYTIDLDYATSEKKSTVAP
jgi:hypothetical protein